MDDSIQQLVERAQRGDDTALSSLLEHVGLDLQEHIERQIGPRYRGKFGADDVLQVTFLEAFLRIGAIKGEGAATFGAWIRRIADNNLRDAIRELERDCRPSPGREVRAVDPDASYAALVEQVAITTQTPSRACAKEDIRRGVDSALRELPAEYEQALRLFELEGLSGEEVAGRMGRSHGAVRMLLARARERLAEVLGSDSRFFSTSG